MAKWIICLSKQLDKHPKTDFTLTNIEAENKEDAEKIAIEKSTDDNPDYKIWIRETKMTVK